MRGEVGRIRRRVGGEERGRQEEDMEESGGKGRRRKWGEEERRGEGGEGKRRWEGKIGGRVGRLIILSTLQQLHMCAGSTSGVSTSVVCQALCEFQGCRKRSSASWSGYS